MSVLTHARLLQTLTYFKTTGVFRWKVATSNRVSPGDIAGFDDSKGHWTICLDGKKYQAHRLAWFYVTGQMPESQIDHKNGKGLDNRFKNLREATPAVNAQNLHGPRGNNKVGLLGVYVCNRTQRFRSQIRANGVVIHLGRFDTAKAAHRAYLRAKRKYHQGNTL